MTYLIVKALLSGIIIAAASEIARRWPGAGALIVSLPTVSLLTMIWLWRDTGDPERIALLSESTFWFFLPSMPLFLLLPALLRAGFGFWAAMLIACAVTVALYFAMVAIGPRFGLRI